MEITTIQKYMHTSPRKLRLVADMVRKMAPEKAISVLEITPQAAARDLQKAIQTVLANAKQQGVNLQKIIFQKIEINESTKMRRFRAGTRGRVKPYKRRMSHIKIILTDDKIQNSKIKTDVKTEKTEIKEKK
ncbi:50S ribosomal protein L22 [Candidatus Daviesbacteria bacterium]|nr:50S ribosomal protein L22 [Candidatus Daviesbacteria bacterium]